MVPKYSYPEDKYVLVGKVRKPHGMCGEVSILSFSGIPDQFQDFGHVVLVSLQGKLSIPLQIERCRSHGKDSVLVVFREVSSRNEAEDITGAGVLITKDQLPPLRDDEYYWHELYGKDVFDTDNNEIGSVTSLFNNGAQDVLVIRQKVDSRELLVPITRSTLISTENGCLVIDPPPGLLDINNAQ